MSHEIDFTTGLPAIAYRGDKPWHGYGQEIEEDASLETWRQQAGLNWDVIRKPVFCNVYRDLEEESEDFYTLGARGTNFSNYKKVPRKVALLRSDTHDMLSLVSDRYKVVQPEQVLEFFRTLIARNGFKMHTAGALKGGRRVWALAETGKDFELEGDKVAAYLLLATSYDGTFATTAQFTSIRVVCNNTLEWSLDSVGESAGVIKIPHSQEFDEVEVKLGLGLDVSWDQFTRVIEKLAAWQVTDREAIDYFLDVLGTTEEEVAETGSQLINVKKLLSFFQSGPGSDLSTASGTAWGLVNAVTFFVDHNMRSKNAGTRFDSASFGTGARLKRRALKKAIELTKGTVDESQDDVPIVAV